MNIFQNIPKSHLVDLIEVSRKNILPSNSAYNELFYEVVFSSESESIKYTNHFRHTIKLGATKGQTRRATYAIELENFK